MTIRSITETFLVLTLISALASCGSSNDKPVEGTTTEESTPTIAEAVASAVQTGADRSATKGEDDIDVNDPNPRVITSTCDSLPVSDTPVAFTQASANSIVEGQLVRGRIHPSLDGSEENYWNINLPAGYHHVFVDVRRSNGSDGNFGLEVDLVDTSGALDQSIGNYRGFDFRTRGGQFFFRETPGKVTLNVKLTGGVTFTGPQDYVMGIFANGRSIPSPFFDDCPTITPLSVDTTTTLRLQESKQASNTVNYTIELARGEYTLATQASQVNGEARTFNYTFKLHQLRHPYCAISSHA